MTSPSSDFAELDYYEMLGIARDATTEEIAAAFRAAAQREHPDRSDHRDAHDRMILLNQARTVLLDPVQRMLYDQIVLGVDSSLVPSDAPPSVPDEFDGTLAEWLLAWAQYQQSERDLAHQRLRAEAEEARQREQRERVRQAERERLEREEAARRQREERERRERERQVRERTEIAAFGDDIFRLRRWFDSDRARRTRHVTEYAALVRREQEQEQTLRERERAEIRALGDDIDGLRRWFDSDRTRRPRHRSEYEELTRVAGHWRHRSRAHLFAAVGSVIAFARDVFSVQRLRRDARRLPRLLVSLILSLRTRKVLLLAGSYLLLSIGAVAGWSGLSEIIIWTVLIFCWFSAKRLGRSDLVRRRTK